MAQNDIDGQAGAVTALPVPVPGDEVEWVRQHLVQLIVDPVRASTIHGGQSSADAALAAFDVTGYAEQRNEVWPLRHRGSSRLSPYIRHGLLSLPQVWHHVSGSSVDVAKFRDELLWQEYSRHLYARVGGGNARSLRFEVVERTEASADWEQWPGDMACVDMVVRELRDDGWIPNQTRMWLASHWSVRDRFGWRDGEDAMFRRLLDGSRAANRVGWQWTVGALTGKPYGFSRQQVQRRAPGVCEQCALKDRCPIAQWPPDAPPDPVHVADPALRRGSLDLGPVPAGGETSNGAAANGAAANREAANREAEYVWVTAESLGDGDPALRARPDLPAVFVWDAPLLKHLRLSSTRLVFIAQCLADLAQRRELQVRLGDPVAELCDCAVETTRAPVPGWRSRAEHIRPVALHPWEWLVPSNDGPVTSFTAWRRRARV